MKHNVAPQLDCPNTAEHTVYIVIVDQKHAVPTS